MAVTSHEPTQENPTDRYPLLMEPQENHENHDHVIDIERVSDASSSGSSQKDSPCDTCLLNHEDGSSSSVRVPIIQSPSSTPNGSDPHSNSFTRRTEGFGRRHWSPFNTVLWLSIELVFTVCQIIVAIVVLSISGNEKPQTPLFAWIVGYASGCAASLPAIYWRYLHRNQGSEQGSARQDSSRGNSTSEPNSYITISLTRSSEEENDHNASTSTWNGRTLGATNSRLTVLMDNFKMALDCFFAVWFVVGNVWIFGGHSSSSDAPNLYRLCLVFLTFSCIGYAMPFILCAMICCCLPCIISILGIRDDMHRVRGANEETINALPKHKFKSKKTGGGDGSGRDSNSGVDEGGIVAAGTEKERAISEEDAVCCICLAKYSDNDDLRELPCSHFFHTECVDKWLKINASCPLCKFEITDHNDASNSATDTAQQV